MRPEPESEFIPLPDPPGRKLNKKTPVNYPAKRAETGELGPKEYVTTWGGCKTPKEVIYLARMNASVAMKRLVDLMNGIGGKKTIVNKDGEEVEVDIEVPAAVQARCAEIILERGYGKTPQALLLQTESLINAEQTLTIAQKIVALRQAREEEERTRNLEASEVQEVPPAPTEAKT